MDAEKRKLRMERMLARTGSHVLRYRIARKYDPETVAKFEARAKERAA